MGATAKLKGAALCIARLTTSCRFHRSGWHGSAGPSSCWVWRWPWAYRFFSSWRVGAQQSTCFCPSQAPWGQRTCCEILRVYYVLSASNCVHIENSRCACCSGCDVARRLVPLESAKGRRLGRAARPASLFWMYLEALPAVSFFSTSFYWAATRSRQK